MLPVALQTQPPSRYKITQRLRTISGFVGYVTALSYEAGEWWYKLEGGDVQFWFAERNIEGEIQVASFSLADVPLHDQLGDCLSVDYDKQLVVFRSRESAVVFKRFNPEWTVQFERIMEASAVYPTRKPAPRRRPGSGTYPQTGAFR